MIKKLVYILSGLSLLCVSTVFALTPKETKGVKTLKAAHIEYLSPDRFTPFNLAEAPQQIEYWTSLLATGDRDADLYIVLPTLGLIAPVIDVPKDSADYTAMRAGKEINIDSYLINGVMHYAGTASPGEEGNIVIFGHSNFYKAAPGRYKTIFADIMNLDAHSTDEIWLYKKTLDGTYAFFPYAIERSYETVPTDTKVLRPTGGKELTVLACTNGLAGRRILKAREIPEGEKLIPYEIKLHLLDLKTRLDRLDPEVQATIRERVLVEIEQKKTPAFIATPLRIALFNYIQQLLLE